MKKAFTLIELLVVIAIIAILAAILFPVFAQAKAAAKKTQALSNVKQTGTGIQIYLGDSDDVYPRGEGCGWWGPQDGNWIEDTKPYIKSVPILRDPSDPLSKSGYQNWYTDSGIVPISLVSNGYMDDRGSGWEVRGLMGMDQSKAISGDPRCNGGNPGWMARGTTNSSQVTTPADTIALSERFNSHTIYGTGSIITGEQDGWGWPTAAFSLRLPDATRDGKPLTVTVNGGTFTVNKDNRFGGVTPAYQDKNAVFAFADGHAKAMDARQTNPLGTTTDAGKAKNMWDALR